ncbi:MAG TPA: hypothetical protein VFX12_02350 [Vicinamibacterales bacterium]|nr:hypothetical protein [Vicinamibacterales bacterium]
MRDAFREVMADRGSSLAIAATLALGIGATAAAYAVFDRLLFRPVPGLQDANRIVTVKFERPNGAHADFGYSSRAAADVLRRASAFDVLAVSYTAHASVLAGDAPGAEVSDVEVIGDGYLRALGVRASDGSSPSRPAATGRPARCIAVSGLSERCICDRPTRVSAHLDRTNTGGAQPSTLLTSCLRDTRETPRQAAITPLTEQAPPSILLIS